MREHAARTLDYTCHALRAVELGPVVWLRFDFVSEQFACDHTVRKAVAGITRDYVCVLGALIEADESHVVDGIEDLTGLGVVDATGGSEAFACPGLEFGETACGVFLADFVVAAADDHVVVLVVAVCQADVLVSFSGIVQEAVFDCSLGDLDGDAVGAHVLHLGYDAELLESHTSSHDGIVAVNGLARLCLDHSKFFIHDERYRHAFLGNFQHPGIGVAAEVGLLLEPFEDADPVQSNF